jgi:hypothetical protein
VVFVCEKAFQNLLNVKRCGIKVVLWAHIILLTMVQWFIHTLVGGSQFFEKNNDVGIFNMLLGLIVIIYPWILHDHTFFTSN